MAKSKEELDVLKQEYESLVEKLKELSEDELITITGGEHRMPEIREDEKYVLK